MTTWFSDTNAYLKTLMQLWIIQTQDALKNIRHDYPWLHLSIELHQLSSTITCQTFTDVNVLGSIDFSVSEACTWIQSHYPHYNKQFVDVTPLHLLQAFDILKGNWVNHNILEHDNDPLHLLCQRYGLFTQEWISIFNIMNRHSYIHIGFESIDY